jgi:hypothetical protein
LLPTLVGLFGCGSSDIIDEGHVVVIGYGDGLQSARPACLYKLACVSLALFIGNCVIAGPIMIARRVDLQIAAVEMCSFIHERSPILSASETLQKISNFFVFLCDVFQRLMPCSLGRRNKSYCERVGRQLMIDLRPASMRAVIKPVRAGWTMLTCGRSAPSRLATSAAGAAPT